MFDWWPWKRSNPEEAHAAPVAARATSPAAERDPHWRNLPPMQRVLADPSTVSRTDEFTSSLSTARDPSFVSPQLPTFTDRSGQLPVLAELRAAPEPRPAPAQPTASAPRSWQRAPLATQRMAWADGASPATGGVDQERGSSQGDTASPTVARIVEPLPTTSLTSAQDPGEYRGLEVVEPVAWTDDAGHVGTPASTLPAIPGSATLERPAPRGPTPLQRVASEPVAGHSPSTLPAVTGRIVDGPSTSVGLPAGVDTAPRTPTQRSHPDTGPHRSPTPAAIQRSPSVSDPGTPEPPTGDRLPTGRIISVPSSAGHLPPAFVSSGPAATPLGPSSSGTVQRSSVSTVSSTSTATPPRSRLVLLPPQSSGAAHGNGGPSADTSGTTEGATEKLFQIPAPMSLQRIYEQAVGPHTVGSGHVERSDNGATTVTFGSAVAQRAVDDGPTPDSPMAAPSTPTTAPEPSQPATSVPAAKEDPAELVNRIYDTLAARLRTELWLDRERAGVLMGVHR
jgi:hypothetical protein